MDNKKFEQLIEFIINEDEEKARELFHDIVVEKSREIYEQIMDEEMEDMTDEGMGGQVGDLLDEISAEESGAMSEDDMDGMDDMEDMDDLEGEEEVVDIESDDASDGQLDAIEDSVVRIEDKLEQLMAEFEARMGEEEGEEGDESEEDFADMADDEGEEEGEEGEEEMMETMEEESVMEAVTLKKVGGQTYNTFGKMGDNGAQTKSPGLHNSGQAGMDSKPVKFSGQAEAVPTAPKAPNNAYTKGETEVKHAKQWKNAPAQAGQDLEKAPAPVKSQASGVNNSSPVAESKKATKKIVK